MERQGAAGYTSSGQMSWMSQLAALLASSDRLAFRHYDDHTVHLFTDCPEGKPIGIAARDGDGADAVTGVLGCGPPRIEHLAAGEPHPRC